MTSSSPSVAGGVIRVAPDRSAGPLRVLHVVGPMSRGGVETWLMHVLRRVERARIECDLLSISDRPGDYDAEAMALGAKVSRCPGHTRPWSFLREAARILRRDGPYDVVHSHVGYFSGVMMPVAAAAHVPIRIVHSHNTLHGPPVPSAPRALYERLCAQLIQRYATAGFAVSSPAAESLFGRQWRRDPRWRVLSIGIDLAPFENSHDRARLRADLRVPEHATVLGHVGRFAAQKNHGFLVEVFAEIASGDPSSHLLLVGEGPLRQAVERRVATLGLGERVTFAGVRTDVPALLAAMDVLVMPSHHEGLPLVLLEAQAAGLPAVVAATIPEEGCVVDRLVCRVPLEESPAHWAGRILASLARGTDRQTACAARQALRDSPFNIDVNMRRMIGMYEELRTGRV